MMKRLLSFAVILGLACSVLLPNSFVHAEAEDSGDIIIDEETNVEMEQGDEEVEEVAPSGINAGTLIVIVLLTAIIVILLYSFVFKKKK